jgi:hypothetical protein
MSGGGHTCFAQGFASSHGSAIALRLLLDLAVGARQYGFERLEGFEAYCSREHVAQSHIHVASLG